MELFLLIAKTKANYGLKFLKFALCKVSNIGGAFDEDAIHNNFVLIHVLLDGNSQAMCEKTSYADLGCKSEEVGINLRDGFFFLHNLHVVLINC